jgi:GNAT superfamily N-acetyltransferase
MTASEPPRTEHRDRSGRPVMTYVLDSAYGRSAAFDVAPAAEVDLVDLVDLISRDLAGWVISGPAELGDQLAERGGQVRRRFHVLNRSLTADPPPVSWAETDLGAGRRAARYDRDPDEIFPTYRAAYPPSHPDGHPGTDEEALDQRLRPLLAGELGPVLPASRLAVDADDHVVAGVFLLETPRGPWVADVFRRPGAERAGLGTALLRQVLAIAAEDGITELGLSVTDGNPARGVYEKLGFHITASLVTLSVPEISPK